MVISAARSLQTVLLLVLLLPVPPPSLVHHRQHLHHEAQHTCVHSRTGLQATVRGRQSGLLSGGWPTYSCPVNWAVDSMHQVLAGSKHEFCVLVQAVGDLVGSMAQPCSSWACSCSSMHHVQ